jgi:hypothetical protein
MGADVAPSHALGLCDEGRDDFRTVKPIAFAMRNARVSAAQCSRRADMALVPGLPRRHRERAEIAEWKFVRPAAAVIKLFALLSREAVTFHSGFFDGWSYGSPCSSQASRAMVTISSLVILRSEPHSFSTRPFAMR